MRPVDQLFVHDPDNGVYGDCMRACVASLLELPAEEVPHFMQDNPPTEEFNRRVNAFLATHGLIVMTIPYFDVQGWKDGCGISDDVFHIISGPSPRHIGAHHAVVGRNGVPVFDPHPTRLMLRDDEKNEWVCEFFVALCGSRESRPGDTQGARVRATHEPQGANP